MRYGAVERSFIIVCKQGVVAVQCLVKGHADKDIKHQMMGKIDLEMTVKFIKANEAGKKADDYLDGGDVMWLEGSCLRAASSFI